ncbi:MAG: thioredoxin domain-containing protein, partial [Bacteroidota bacterium]
MNSKFVERNSFSNLLVEETSPYLIQHSHNPVNWFPWSEQAFLKAQKEDKLILISIGYAACHWCHVMERECFEDLEVAEIMNKHFVCIKVDREERPDVDQVYMNAVQLITQQGGWPLNCFALPDGRPVYGGTYFPKVRWIKVLESLVESFEKDREQFMEYATKLTKGVKLSEQPFKENEIEPTKEILIRAVNNWQKEFDNRDGGPDKAPKFPLPKNYDFLLSYGFLFKDNLVIEHAKLTLDKMMMGGIYDQIGGGFARYSVDHLWKVPHFEKMLYDNAQLISLYSKAYSFFKNQEYKTVVEETIAFCKRELFSTSGVFFSALDADSEGEEGKFYVWTEQELKEVLKDDYSLAHDFYCINNKALWEHHNNILVREKSIEEFAVFLNCSVSQTQEKLKEIKQKLLAERGNRIRPQLDDKILLSWNALMISSLVEAYFATTNDLYLYDATVAAEFIINKNSFQKLIKRNYKSKADKENVFLEDYSTVIESFLILFEATGNTKWAEIANSYLKIVFAEYLDFETSLFYYTSSNQNDLIARKIELQDNVIPSSNSIMANNIHKLHKIYGTINYFDCYQKMLSYNIAQVESYSYAYANWAVLLQKITMPFYELV